MAGVPIPLTPVEHQLAWTTPLAELRGQTRSRSSNPSCGTRIRTSTSASAAITMRSAVTATSRSSLTLGHPPAWRARRHSGLQSVRSAAFEPAWRESLTLLPVLHRRQHRRSHQRHVLVQSRWLSRCSVNQTACAVSGWQRASGSRTPAGAARAIAQLMTRAHSDLDLHESDLHRFEAHATTLPYIRERGAQQYREVYDVLHPLQPLERPRPLRRTPFYAQEQAAWRVLLRERAAGKFPAGTRSNAPLLQQFPVSDRDGWSGKFWSPIAGAEHLATRHERRSL